MVTSRQALGINDSFLSKIGRGVRCTYVLCGILLIVDGGTLESDSQLDTISEAVLRGGQGVLWPGGACIPYESCAPPSVPPLMKLVAR